MRLSPHFDLSEFVVSQTAQRRGIDNTPTPEIVENLKRTALLLEKVRAILGRPIIITSGYRCDALNLAVGGVPGRSSHVTGQAADFICPGYGPPSAVCRAIADTPIPFDQLIREFDDGNGGGWTHISWADNPRRQLLTIDGSGARYGI